MNNLTYAIPVAIGALFAIVVVGANAVAFGVFPVENLNTFITENQTTGMPVLNVVGEFTNNGTNTEDYVDLIATLYDSNGKIIDVENFYEDDIKTNDTIAFKLPIPVENLGGEFNRLRVTAD